MFERLYRQVTRLFRDDQGADLVEYGLLASIIAIAGVLAFPSIFAKLDAAFETWGQNVYNAWVPDDPQ